MAHRAIAPILLAAATLLFLAACLPYLPMASHAFRDEGFRITTDITPWGFEQSAGAATGFRWWFEESGDASVVLLQVSGPVTALAVAMTALATAVCARGFASARAMTLVAAALQVCGMTLFVAGVLGLGGATRRLDVGFYAGVAALAATVLAAVFVRRASPRPRVPAPRAFVIQAAPAGDVHPNPAPPRPARHGRCPKCRTAVTIVAGHKTTCPGCGFTA